MTASTLHRLGLTFRIEWWLRGLFAVALMGCSAPVKRCEFPLWVTVMPTEEVDTECRRLGAKWKDMGGSISDRDTILGCAMKDRIIYNGQELTGGHELNHAYERNCR